MKRVAIVLLLLTLLIPVAVQAAVSKLTFTAEIDSQTVVIEASQKENNQGSYTTCSYFSEDYANYLGQYAASDALTSPSESEVKSFCVANFDNRTT